MAGKENFNEDPSKEIDKNGVDGDEDGAVSMKNVESLNHSRFHNKKDI